MTKLGTKWVRNDQTGYEMTKLKIKVGTKWPKWYEMTWVRNDLGTKWPVTLVAIATQPCDVIPFLQWYELLRLSCCIPMLILKGQIEGLLPIPDGLTIPNTPPFMIGTDSMACVSSVVWWHASFAWSVHNTTARKGCEVFDKVDRKFQVWFL